MIRTTRREIYLSGNHPYQNNSERPTVHLEPYLPAEEHLDRWRRILTRGDHDSMFKPAYANVSIYAEEDCRWPDVTMYYASTVYETDARCLPRLSG